VFQNCISNSKNSIYFEKYFPAKFPEYIFKKYFPELIFSNIFLEFLKVIGCRFEVMGCRKFFQAFLVEKLKKAQYICMFIQ